MAVLDIQTEGAGVGNIRFRAGNYVEIQFDFKKKEGEVLTAYPFAGTPKIILHEKGKSARTLSAGSGVTVSGSAVSWKFSYGMEKTGATYEIVDEVDTLKRDTVFKGQLLPQFDLLEYSVTQDISPVIEKKAITMQVNITKGVGGGNATIDYTVIETQSDYTPAESNNSTGFFAGLLTSGKLKMKAALDKIVAEVQGNKLGIETFVTGYDSTLPKLARKDIADNTLGTLYNFDFTNSGSIAAFTKIGTGATFTPSAAGLVISKATPGFGEHLEITNYVTALPDITIEGEIVVGTMDANSKGIAFSLLNKNPHTGSLRSSHFVLNLSSTTTLPNVYPGKMEVHFDNTLAVQHASPAHVDIAAGNTILFKVRLRGQRVDLSSSMSGGIILNHASFVNFFAQASSIAISAVGGTHTLKNLKVSSDTQKNQELMLLGDSIFWGSQVSPVNDRLSVLLSKRLGKTVNAYASPGATAGVFKSFINEIIALAPKIVILMLGTNDRPYVNNTTTYTTDMNTIINGLKAANIYVIVCVPMPRNDVDMSTYYAAGIGLSAANRRISLFQPFRSSGTNSPIAALMAADGVHPNAAGHKVMFNIIVDRTKDIIEYLRTEEI